VAVACWHSDDTARRVIRRLVSPRVDCCSVGRIQQLDGHYENGGPRPEGKRLALPSGRHPDVRIAHIGGSMLAEDVVVVRDLRRRDEQKPGSASM
jgi:hypothetical protein